MCCQLTKEMQSMRCIHEGLHAIAHKPPSSALHPSTKGCFKTLYNITVPAVVIVASTHWLVTTNMNDKCIASQPVSWECSIHSLSSCSAWPC